MRLRVLGTLSISGLVVACASGDDVNAASGGGGGTTSTTAVVSTAEGTGGHGCFATETLCAGTCVDITTNPAHCGMCDNPCAAGQSEAGACVDGMCTFSCAGGLVADEDGGCTNLRGAHEPYPTDCAGCATANAVTQACSCPPGTVELPLAVQSDCPGVPMRAKTNLNLCVANAVAPESDFGGAYQLDDIAGWCGATAQCRVGNPLAGGACACPDGFATTIGLRSIFRLPCDDAEAGSTIVLCGKQGAPVASFGGAYQYDDFAPNCRVPNPYTGDCTCPAGTVDQVHRVMVDGAMGLYGSTIHLCLD